MAWLGAIFTFAAADESPPLVFVPDGAAIDLRIPLTAPPAPMVPSYSLIISAPVPSNLTVLKIANPRFEPVPADTGERLGLLVRQGNRLQAPGRDRALRRDRLVRVVCDLTPPRRDCGFLHDLRGSVAVTLASGQPIDLAIPFGDEKAKDPVPVPGLDQATVTVGERGERRVILAFTANLAERLGPVSFIAADGSLLPVRPGRIAAGDDKSVRYSYDLDPKTCARIVVSWYPTVRSLDIPISIARLDLPGGLPGIGDLEAPPAVPPATPAPPAKPSFKAPLNQFISNSASAASGEAEAVVRLLATPSDLEGFESDGRHPLQRAAYYGNPAIVRLLLEAKADPNSRSKDGYTALHLAATGWHDQVAAVLLDHGAAVNATNTANGWTALHTAIYTGNLALARILLAHGADPHAANADERTGFDFARDYGRWRIMRLMLGNPEEDAAGK